MMRNTLEIINKWWDSPEFRFSVINRPLYVTKNSLQSDRLIKIFVGSRRVGKTNLLYSIINLLLEDGVKAKNILYLAGEMREFESQRLSDLVIEYIHTMKLKADARFFLVIDEVQEIPYWQKDLKFLYDNFNVKIYVTGSSSLVLTEGTSKLTGRFYLNHVLPLNFEEYLAFTNQKYPKGAEARTAITEEFLKDGGYPEYVLNKKPDYLRQVIDSTLYRDLISLYGVRNPSLLKDLLYYLADKATTPVSPKTIEKDLKINDETARFYLKYLQDVYIIYPAYRFGSSHRITKSSNPKYYFNDTGVLFSTSLNKRISHLAENAVFLKLFSRSLTLEQRHVHYYISKGSQEVDFMDLQRNLFEVKYKQQLDWNLDISPYESLGVDINFVHHGLAKTKDLAFYHLKPQELGSFLLS